MQGLKRTSTSSIPGIRCLSVSAEDLTNRSKSIRDSNKQHALLSKQKLLISHCAGLSSLLLLFGQQFLERLASSSFRFVVCFVHSVLQVQNLPKRSNSYFDGSSSSSKDGGNSSGSSSRQDSRGGDAIREATRLKADLYGRRHKVGLRSVWVKRSTSSLDSRRSSLTAFSCLRSLISSMALGSLF